MSTAFHATRTAVSAVSIALAMWVYAPAANAQSFLGFKPAGKSEETSTKGSAGTSAKASACEEVYPGVWRIRFGEPEKVMP
ncbi:MAG: hypothetical protein FWC56_05000, partial [Phycisphaerae bacterium]|nr:hypothetical protein [Phycisphaerae bacterium]